MAERDVVVLILGGGGGGGGGTITNYFATPLDATRRQSRTHGDGVEWSRRCFEALHSMNGRERATFLNHFTFIFRRVFSLSAIRVIVCWASPPGVVLLQPVLYFTRPARVEYVTAFRCRVRSHKDKSLIS